MSKKNILSQLKIGLVRTKEKFSTHFLNVFWKKKINEDFFETLEDQLLAADLGVKTTQKIIHSLVLASKKKKLYDSKSLYLFMKKEMEDMLISVEKPLIVERKKPFIIVMVGVNGVGKTTTIGKLAYNFKKEKKSVLLASGDTFRAAAKEQLDIWGKTNKVPVMSQNIGADPASVIFDAVHSAKSQKIDIVIADTAGRLHNKVHLMEELKKIIRVIKKIDATAPHEIMLVIDANTGQNAVTQADLFCKAVPVSGITLTKLDSSSKGGVIFPIANCLNIPIRYIGIGDSQKDLRIFNGHDFIKALFEDIE